MKLIIEHQGIKREIRGPFNICGDRRSLMCIANRIIDAAPHYGWVLIYETEAGKANLAPISWKEKG